MKNLKMAKTYISGPITGHTDGNRPAFSGAAELLLECGTLPVNPHDVTYLLPPGSTWIEYMKADIPALVDCDEIYMLRGWWRSRGARVEWALARILGLRISYE